MRGNLEIKFLLGFHHVTILKVTGHFKPLMLGKMGTNLIAFKCFGCLFRECN